MKIGALSASLLLLLLSAGRARAGTDVGNGKVYVGENGVIVTVVPSKTSGPPGDHKVLVAVAGTGSPFDGKVLPHDVTDDGERTNYETTYHGRRWITLAVRDAARAPAFGSTRRRRRRSSPTRSMPPTPSSRRTAP